MLKTRSAGDLQFRVAFDKRDDTNDPDNDGNYQGAWVEQFQTRAGYIHLRGGESVLASRLQGLHSQVIFVRASSETRQITTDWRVRDVRTGEFDGDGRWTGVSYNIRDITPTVDRQWVELLVQSGGAEG